LPPPALPDFPVKFDIDTLSGYCSQLTPLEPPESQLLFHHTNWIALTSLSCDQEVLPIFGMSPMSSSTTVLSLTAVIASALRDKVKGLGIPKNQRRSRHKSKLMVQIQKVYISSKR